MLTPTCTSDGLGLVDESCRLAKHRLQTAYQVGWNANQYCIGLVESRVYQSHYEHLERGCRHRSADLAQLAESSEAPRHRSFDVLPHRQVCVSVNAEITDGPRRGDWDANDRYRSGWQLMLTPTCCSPDGLGFVRVQHQPVLPRPVHSVNGAVGNLR